MHDITARHEDGGSTSSEEGAKILPLPGLQSGGLPQSEKQAPPREAGPDKRSRPAKPLTVSIAAGIGCLLGAALVVGAMVLGRIWPAHPVQAHTVLPLSSQPVTSLTTGRPQPSSAPGKPARHSRSHASRRRHHTVPLASAPVVGQPQATPVRSHHNKHAKTHHRPPVVPPAGADVTIQAADGSSSLGRNVIASGTVGGTPYTCFAVGWYVINAKQWTGYFIKTLVRAGPDGSFATEPLQLGSPGETTSSWWPFLLGGTPSGCAWLTQLWGQTAIGEYHGAWPPPGLTLLYWAPAPIHRTY